MSSQTCLNVDGLTLSTDCQPFSDLRQHGLDTSLSSVLHGGDATDSERCITRCFRMDTFDSRSSLSAKTVVLKSSL